MESCGDFYNLPENCIANALSLTTPKDACRLSAVCSTFRSAAESDGVWERFLPSDYRDIISHSIDGSDSLLENFRSKKDLYFHLSDHSILIDSGLKSFTLEKWSSKKCYMLAARGLTIVCGGTSQHWQWISLPESSRFSEVAELLAVCWFDISGSINTKILSSRTNYAAYLVFMFKSRMNGFDRRPGEAYVGISGHEMEKRTVCLDPDGARRRRRRRIVIEREVLENMLMDDNMETPSLRKDGWMEVELGEYYVKGDEDGDLEMNLMEHGSQWKSGIVIQGIEIRPKN